MMAMQIREPLASPSHESMFDNHCDNSGPYILQPFIARPH